MKHVKRTIDKLKHSLYGHITTHIALNVKPMKLVKESDLLEHYSIKGLTAKLIINGHLTEVYSLEKIIEILYQINPNINPYFEYHYSEGNKHDS